MVMVLMASLSDVSGINELDGVLRCFLVCMWCFLNGGEYGDAFASKGLMVGRLLENPWRIFILISLYYLGV